MKDKRKIAFSSHSRRTFNPTFPSGFTIGRSRCVDPATPMSPEGARRVVGTQKYRKSIVG
jgi:hypothetical protein